jgi:diguanylate cyclase (GGDEF)-like protein/PAS domain S-box-containing protein
MNTSTPTVLAQSWPFAGCGESDQRIMDELARAALLQTPFRRALITRYERPIHPEAQTRTRVVAYATSGLSERDEAQVHALLESGWEVSAARFSRQHKIGASYYIPQPSDFKGCQPRVPSRRRFMRPGGWSANDLLLVPLYCAEGCFGTLSVDDPRDGAIPSRSTLETLEGLARLGSGLLTSAPGLSDDETAEKLTLFSFLAEHCMVGLLVTKDEQVDYVNRRVVDLFGYTREELRAMRPWWQVIHPEDRLGLTGGGTSRDGIRARAIRKDGSQVWVLVRTYQLELNGQEAHLVDLWDISEQIETEGALKQKALRDPLTGLYNRHYFEESIRAELRRARRYNRSFTLVMADLKGFKRVNDSLGHAKGDEVLQSIASVLKAAVRESDWLVRYGGDEFLIVLPETASPVDIVLARLQTAVEDWSRKNLPEIRLSLDVGRATWTPGCERSVTDLVRAADASMYEAKRASAAP